MVECPRLGLSERAAASRWRVVTMASRGRISAGNAIDATPNTQIARHSRHSAAVAAGAEIANNSQDTGTDRVQRLVPRVDALLEGALEGREGHGLGGRDMFIK